MVEGTQVSPGSCGGTRQVIPKIYRASAQEIRQGGREEQSEDTEEGDDLSTSPISWLPHKGVLHSQTCQCPWEGPRQVDPCKGGKEQLSTTAPPLPWVGKGTGGLGRIKKSQEEPQWVGRSFPTPQHELGKGNVSRVGTEEVMGAAGREGEENSNREQKGQAGYGEGSSLHPAQKIIVKHPQNPPQTPSTPPSTSQWEMGRQTHPLKSASSLKHLGKDHKGKEEEKNKWKKRCLKLN